MKESFYDWFFNTKFFNWIDIRIINHRSRKDLLAYLDEAENKVWSVRNGEDSDSWDYGYWSGVMATLRWVLGDEEKDNLDT